MCFSDDAGMGRGRDGGLVVEVVLCLLRHVGVSGDA